jgi:hypothetical protein
MLPGMDANRRQERIRLLGAALPSDLGSGASALAQSEHGEATLSPEAEREAMRLHTLLEVAFLAAAADGKLDDAEIHNLAANLEAWLNAEIEPGFLVELFDDLAGHLVEEGFPARLAHAAATLDEGSRHVAYKLACVTALVDLEVHDDELGVLGKIADAFGIPEAQAQAIFDELDETVGSIATGG